MRNDEDGCDTRGAHGLLAEWSRNRIPGRLWRKYLIGLRKRVHQEEKPPKNTKEVKALESVLTHSWPTVQNRTAPRSRSRLSCHLFLRVVQKRVGSEVRCRQYSVVFISFSDEGSWRVLRSNQKDRHCFGEQE